MTLYMWSEIRRVEVWVDAAFVTILAMLLLGVSWQLVAVLFAWAAVSSFGRTIDLWRKGEFE